MMRISPWLLHMTMSATNRIYAEMPMDDNRFSAIKTSEKVPSDKTNARIQPIAKNQRTTSQYILEINDWRSRNFMSSYIVFVFILLPDSISSIIESDSSFPTPALRDISINFKYLYTGKYYRGLDFLTWIY